jgi:hypothetical protein
MAVVVADTAVMAPVMATPALMAVGVAGTGSRRLRPGAGTGGRRPFLSARQNEARAKPPGSKRVTRYPFQPA